MLFFDERFNFVQESSTTMRVGGVPGPNASLTAANLKAPKNGYAYVYVSNESQEPVYFDNLQVAHTRGSIAEETHYYSYGLQIAAISSKKVADPREGTLDNRYGYNDKELWDDADLNWLDYGFRNYDPQIGRFMQLDPLADDYAFLSPYLYAYDDPIANVDVDGLFGEGILSTTAATAKTLSGVTVTAVRSTATVVKAGGVFMNGLSTVISVSTRLISTAQNAVSILNTSPTVRQVGDLGMIATRGAADAVNNAAYLGLLGDFNHVDDYSTMEEKIAYLEGRQAGNGIAMAIGAGEVKSGGGAAMLGLASGPGAAIFTTTGGIIALHGTVSAARAGADMIQTRGVLKRLYQLNMSASGENDGANKKSSSTGSTTWQGKSGSKVLTQWGWSGTKVWKDLVNIVRTNPGTIEKLGGKIPKKFEAIRLIEEGGGRVGRIERGHLPPNPHSYNHINYTTQGGKKATIRIQDL